MSAHTPGPWEAVDDPRFKSAANVYAPAAKKTVCSARRDDARLIAQAPELARLLAIAVNAAWGDYSWVDEARAAIAAAEGK